MMRVAFGIRFAAKTIWPAAAWVFAVAALNSPCAAEEKKLKAEQVEFFESKIRPILVEHCYECHSNDSEDVEGSLLLDSKWGWETGGDSGAAIVPGNLEESILIDAVRYEENIVSAMPPDSKLSAQKIKLLEKWVEMGAPDPRPKVESSGGGIETFDLQKRLAEYWCWRAVADPKPPTVADQSWPRDDLDRFVLHKLEEAGIKPAKPASRQVWLRRVYFDLIGLPPTPEQIDAFVADTSDNALETVVDQLLDSPHFGEKWARHWMDLVRYAETYGHEFDYPIPQPTEYRDYLIRAFNADVPYDQFVIEHIAGDMLEKPRRNPDEQFNESVIGTGFWYLHEATHAPTDVLKNEADIIDNQLDVFGKAFLGLTVACARCHDHKFDAIATDDYYALSAFIQSSCRQLYPLDPGEKTVQAIGQVRALQEKAGKLMRKANQGRQSPADYFQAAGGLIRGAKDDPSTGQPAAELFDGFEDDYALWKATGDAFGERPANKPIRPQKDFSGRVGKGFLTSFPGSDKPKGEMLSEPFQIERGYIHLKVGGGKRKVGVELLIDGSAVHTAAGENRDDLIDRVWDVREHLGKTATIRVFDNHSGGWGHINVDQIVFSNQPTVGQPSPVSPSSEAIAAAAKQQGLDEDKLAKWVWTLITADVKASEPSAAAVLAMRIDESKRLNKLHTKFQADKKSREDYARDHELFESFDGGALPEGWSTSGHGFQVVGQEPVSLVNPESLPGTIDSGYFGGKATGILRSPTFTITNKNIHVRMRAGKGVKANVIIDNYQMAPYNALLFRGTFVNGDGANTSGQWQWKSLSGDLRKYAGHKAYLEFVDEGDHEIAIDEIWFTDGGPPSPPGKPLAEAFSHPEFSFTKFFNNEVAGLRDGRRSLLVDWLIENELVVPDSMAAGLEQTITEAKQIAATIPRPRYVLAMAEGTREDARVYIRGSHINLGAEVPPRNLTALGGEQLDRLALARQIASSNNPLTARVIVNRLWHHLFGRGIIPSVDDFGPQGQPASHPDLLDHLAFRFMTEDGWSLKTTIRKMVLSQTYRQASVANPANDPELLAKVDPTNALLNHVRVRRLPAESIRDAILTVSGRLDKKQFGGSVPTHRTAFMTGRGARGSGPLDGNGRRTVYLSVYRNFLNPFLLTFDMPNPFGPKGRRSNSNVPAQALTLMNDPFVIQQAKLWSQKLKSIEDPEQRIRSAVKLAHGVEATDSQVDRFEAFVGQQIADGAQPDQAWADLAHTLFNMKSFYFLK